MKKILVILLSIVFAINTNAQIITNVAGNGTAGSNGTGGQAIFTDLNEPTSIAFDSHGNLYFSDQINNFIYKVNTAGIITTIAGGGTSGLGDGGPAIAAQLSHPTGITIDAADNIFIADQYTYRIRKVNTSGIITTVAGNGTPSFSGDGGQATSATLDNPTGVAFDASGNLYIADYSNNRIRIVNTAGIINTFAGNGTAAYTGDGGQAINASFSGPSGVAFDAAGNLFIADRNNNRIRKINAPGIITTVAGNGTAAYSGDCSQATAAELNGPFAVTADAAGNLYIADLANNRIRRVNVAGIISNFAGDGTGAYAGNGGPAITAELFMPAGVTFDALGNLYIADFGNHRIRVITDITISTLTVNSSTICARSTTTLTANGATTYTWSTGATTSSITVNPAVSTTYTVTGMVGSCPAQTITTVSVNLSPDTVVTGNMSICSGQSTSLTAGSANSYTWNTGTNTSSITVNPTKTTTYTVMEAIGTCTSQAVATLTVTQTPTVTVAGSTIICSGTTITLIAGGATTYTWNTGQTTVSMALTPTTTTSYTVVGANGTCTGQAVATITVNPSPKSVITGSTSICSGQSTALTASGANTYTWNTGQAITNITVNPTVTTDYTVVGSVGTCTNQAITTVSVTATPTVSVAGNTAICSGHPTTLTASGASNYIWNTGATAAGIMLTPTANTSYTVIGANGVCTGQAVVTVNVNPSPVLSVIGNTVACLGQSITLTASGASTYSWNTGAITASVAVSPTVNTTYTVVGTTGTCTNMASIRINTSNISLSGNDIICQGNNTTLTASGSDSYLWNTGETTASIVVNPSVTTTYTVLGTTGTCITQAVETVLVNSIPITSVTGNMVICSGQTTTLTASGASTYVWSTGHTKPSITLSPSITTTYSVIGTTGTCTYQAVETILVNPSPTAHYIISPNPTTIASPLVCFTNQSTNYAQWWWDFGDGSAEDSIDINPSHLYDTEVGNSYQTSLTLLNQDGCSKVLTITLLIDPDFTFYIPNTFTPNKDGRNDLFTGTGIGITSFEIWIFDRWGTCIFSSNDINKGWDGTLKNKSNLGQEGLYMWKAEVQDLQKTSHQFSGTVTLIR